MCVQIWFFFQMNFLQAYDKIMGVQNFQNLETVDNNLGL